MKISKTKQPYSEEKVEELLWKFGYYLASEKDGNGNRWKVCHQIYDTYVYNCRNLREVQSVLLALKEQQELKSLKVKSNIIHDGYEWVVSVD